MGRTRDISNIFDDNSPIVNDNELIVAINTASAAAASYADSELAVIDLSSTIQTASAAAVAYLIDGAPGALNTLNELAAALNDDQSFASSVLTTITNASAAALFSANIYTDNATPDLTPAIQAASAAAVAYTDQELSNIDLTSTIITASAAAAAYTDEQLSIIDLTSTIITASAAAAGYADNLIANLAPLISGISPDNIVGTASTAVIINGSNFKSGSIVKLVDINSTELFALSTAFNNARSLQFITPALTASAGPYDVKVINPDNQISILENVLSVGQSPIWITPSGNLTTIFDRYNTGIISTLSATDPDGSNIIYSSNDIPSGLTLNANTGAITGDPTDVSVSTTIPFSVNATDQQGSISQKSLNIIINPSKDGSSSNRAAISASQIIQTTGGGLSNGYYWIKPDGFSGIAKQIYCDMSTSGGGWMLMYWTGGNITYGQGTSGPWLANTDTWNNDNGGANTILTNPTSTGAATVGNSFIDQFVQNYRNTGLVANLRLSGSPLNNFYFNADANSRYLPIAQREGRLSSSNAIDTSNRDNPGNSWWKTCKDSYLTSGQNGAGTPSGSTITYGGEFWGVYPFNMLTGYGGNFGSGIGTYWPDLFAGGHNNGWGQKVVLWLKTSIV